ncbi:hypothetical protein A6770_08025 [Nostoc minutum NIES-26]|uniref:Uncharacterized protein n=1 Tax=Nostoc minutum NIES-26 TaxID=1844469 RepID=A0A367S2D2_9NOSO|nr:hypothetical protein A6770_08025 [Nostoc minutum NIES-26]
MLSGTTVEPPQLDEFLMEGNAPNRAEDLILLGFSEADIRDFQKLNYSIVRAKTIVRFFLPCSLCFTAVATTLLTRATHCLPCSPKRWDIFLVGSPLLLSAAAS